jgi:NADPH-dependent ferric siderophore reductase
MPEDASWIDVDVALQGGGRASAWAMSVAPGTQMAIQGPSGGALAPAPWMGLIGDETAMPVIARQLAAAPEAAQGAAILLLRWPEDAQEIAVPPGITLRYESMECDPLAFLPEITPPAEMDDPHLFFAGERSQATAMRAAFKEAGLPGKCASYWTA